MHTLHRLAHKLLPSWIYDRLIGQWDKGGFKKYFHNTSWIFLAKIISFVISFFTIAIVARYLGPENYGKLSYAQSFVAIFSIFASLGIDLIVYRDLVAHPEKEKEILGTAVFSKLFFGTLTLLVTFASAALLNSDPILTWLTGIMALGFIFQPLSTVGHLFNARVQSKYPSYIAIGVAFLLPILKLLTIYFDKGILYFAAIIAAEALIYGIANVVMYTYLTKQSLLDWRFSPTIFKKLFADSWPLMLAGFSGYIYARIDQVMIQHYLDSTAVGLYEPAVRITEQLGFLPGIIIGSLFPAIINARKVNLLEYKKRFKSLVILCLSISTISATIIFIFSPFIVNLLFGDEFRESATIMRIYTWSTLGTIATTIIYNYLIAEGKSNFFLIFTITGALINISLNMLLIPTFGIQGAAYATLMSLSASVILFLLIRKKIIAQDA